MAPDQGCFDEMHHMAHMLAFLAGDQAFLAFFLATALSAALGLELLRSCLPLPWGVDTSPVSVLAPSMLSLASACMDRYSVRVSAAV